MPENVSVGIIGDHDPKNDTHADTDTALQHAARILGVSVSSHWLPTSDLEDNAVRVGEFDAVFCSPGSPYDSFDGAIKAIRTAREGGVPFTGTCGGFQHAVIEYARNVLGYVDAGHTEYDPDTRAPFISALSCSPFGQRMPVKLEPGSRIHALYGGSATEEEYRCNYGLEPGSRELLERGGLHVSGTDPDGEARVIELPEHPFYVATLFVPQTSSSPKKPHPLIVGFLQAALDTQKKSRPASTSPAR